MSAWVIREGTWVLLGAVSSLLPLHKQWDGGGERGLDMVRGLHTLASCLQQSWVGVARALPQIHNGKAARSQTAQNGRGGHGDTQSPTKFCADLHN